VRAELVAAALAALAGCKDASPSAGPSHAAASAPEPEAMASARRPARRYYLERTAARCEVYRVDEAGTSTPAPTPCPVELLVGERMRIAGKTCMRESSDPERVEPVVCPDPLSNKEKRDLGLLK
jgi:hypothetical protein